MPDSERYQCDEEPAMEHFTIQFAGKLFKSFKSWVRQALLQQQQGILNINEW